MSINLHLLRIFYTVILENGFSNAAKKLFISQPAVSKSVHELENILGFQLIDRFQFKEKQKKQDSLTEEGLVLFEHARAIFTLEQVALEEIKAHQQGKKGKLSIGASTTVAGYWLSPFLSKFSKQYPLVDLCVKVGNTQNISEILIDGGIDIAVVEGCISDKRILVQNWCQEKMEMAVPADFILPKRSKMDFGYLDQCIWLLREAGSGTHNVSLEMIKKLGIVPQNFIELGSNQLIVDAIINGMGISILPERMIKQHVEQGTIKLIDTREYFAMSRPLFILTLEGRPFSRLMQEFYRLLI